MVVLNLNSVINQIVLIQKTFPSAEAMQSQFRRSLGVKGPEGDSP